MPLNFPGFGITLFPTMKCQPSIPNTVVFQTSSAAYEISNKPFQCLKLLLLLPSPTAIPSAVPHPLRGRTYGSANFVQVGPGQWAALWPNGRG